MKISANPVVSVISVILLLLQTIVTTGVVEAQTRAKAAQEAKPIKQVQSTAGSAGNSKSGAKSLGRTTPAEAESMQELLGDLGISAQDMAASGALQGIPVLPNALGDMNDDGIINIWDLLRIRNIHLGIGAPASVFEQAEGDMNLDLVVDTSDLRIVRDVLIKTIGIPHEVDSTGSIVQGAGVTLTFPPGTLNGPSVITARQMDGLDLDHLFGIDVIAETQDENYLFGAFEIKTNNANSFNKPVEISLQLDSIPPCQFGGTNGLFEVLDDLDGDGRSELVLRNLMHPSSDSSQIISDSISSPNLIGVIPATINFRKAGISGSNSFEPGQLLALNCSNLPSRVSSTIITFEDNNGIEINFKPISYIPVSFDSIDQVTGLYTLVPDMNFTGPTNVTVTVKNLLNGQESQKSLITILPSSASTFESRDTVLHFFNLLDSLLINTIDCDTVGFGYYDFLNRVLGTNVGPMKILVDTMIQVILRETDQNAIDKYSQFIQNSKINDTIRSIISGFQIRCGFSTNQEPPYENTDFTYGCPDDGDKVFAWGTVALLGAAGTLIFPGPGTAAGVSAGLAVGGTGMGLYYAGRDRYADCPPPPPPPSPGPPPSPYPTPTPGPGDWGGIGGPGGGNNPTGGTDSKGGKNATGCCINIYRYRQNAQGEIPDPPFDWIRFGEGIPSLSSSLANRFPNGIGEQNNPLSNATANNSLLPVTFWESSLKGAIISPVNVRAAYGVVGIIGAAGNWVIPSLPLNTEITLSIYDPKTGLFDPNVATFLTLSVPGEYAEVIALFNPDTTVCIFPIAIGSRASDSIDSNCPRIEYRINVDASQIGDTINIGFHSSSALTFWLQNPADSFIVKNSSTACENIFGFIPAQAGTHLITVTTGLGGGQGEFTVGVSSFPNPPTPFLCGTIPYDTLLAGFFPYRIAQNTSVAGGDSVFVQSGVTLGFDVGGRLTANGVMIGTGTPSSPIILKPASGPPGAAAEKPGSLTLIERGEEQ